MSFHPPPPPAPKAPVRMMELEDGEIDWITYRLGKFTTVRLLVCGDDMGPQELGKLITLLEAQKAVLEDGKE